MVGGKLQDYKGDRSAPALKQWGLHLMFLMLMAACACCRIQGYPTIKSVVGGRVEDYKGDRSASALKQWGLSLIPSKVATVNKPAQLQELLQRCSSKTGSEAAAWSVCVLLFTAKTETAPLYKSLSAQYAGKIAFGEVRGSNKELSERFHVNR